MRPRNFGCRPPPDAASAAGSTEDEVGVVEVGVVEVEQGDGAAAEAGDLGVRAILGAGEIAEPDPVAGERDQVGAAELEIGDGVVAAAAEHRIRRGETEGIAAVPAGERIVAAVRLTPDSGFYRRQVATAGF